MVSPFHTSFCKRFVKFGHTVEAEQRSTGIGLETFSFESHESSNLKLIYKIIILTRFLCVIKLLEPRYGLHTNNNLNISKHKLFFEYGASLWKHYLNRNKKGKIRRQYWTTVGTTFVKDWSRFWGWAASKRNGVRKHPFYFHAAHPQPLNRFPCSYVNVFVVVW